MASDLELLDAWIAGDSSAAQTLVARYFDPLYAFFRNKVDDDVEDLIQSTYQSCVKYREQFRRASSFKAYLFTTARHELYAHLNRGRRNQEQLDAAVMTVRQLQESPSAVVAHKQEQRLLLEALRRIPLRSQLVLELHYWEDLSTAELAEILEIPPGTAKSRLRRARELLEAALEELADDPTHLHSTLANLEGWARSLGARAREHDASS